MKASIKWFLVQRFIMALVFIAVAEQLLNMLYRYALPTLFDVLQLQDISVTREGSVIVLMLQIVLYFAAQLLPNTMAIAVQYSLQHLMAGGWQLNISAPQLQYVQDPVWGKIYQLGVFFIFLILFVGVLIPYALAVIWYYREISKKVLELLEEEKEQKKAYDKARNLMLSDITHDIKTPITTICGYAKALTDGVVTLDEAKKQEYLQAIYAKSMRMSELITMLFDYVKMDSEGFTLHMEQGDLGELLRENIALLYTDFEEKDMELELEIPEHPFPIEMDKQQLARVITNILNNAIKYNPAGTKVYVGLEENYHITIADNGTQIDDELAAHIFEPFSRGDRSRSTKGGSGLGLSIANKIIQMHGGSLKLNRYCVEDYTKAFEIDFKK